MEGSSIPVASESDSEEIDSSSCSMPKKISEESVVQMEKISPLCFPFSCTSFLLVVKSSKGEELELACLLCPSSCIYLQGHGWVCTLRCSISNRITEALQIEKCS